MGISPPVRTGGQDKFESGVAKAASILGQFVGLGIFAFTIGLVSIEVILNPIFLFAQAKANGVHVGSPFTSMSWWTIIVVTFATTGIQYALLQPGADKKSLGYKIGWAIAIMDTLMDGGGFVAWMNGGNVLKLSGDSHDLLLGVFPPVGKPSSWWVGYFAICAICLLHEPFLGQVLGRLNFEPGPEAGLGAVNISKWTERAGKFHNGIKLITISAAPYIMMGLDVMLFPQSVKGQNSVIQFTWLLLTGVVTLLGMVVWEYWNHIRTEGGYKLKDLDAKHKGIFLGAIGVTIFDSVFDLQGFNQVIFNQSSMIPQNLPPGAIEQFFLTAGLVLLMCTAFEPMNSHLFGPLSRLASMIPGYDEGPDENAGAGDDMGGDAGGGGSEDPFGGEDFKM